MSFQTKNEAKVLIVRGIEKGVYKNCIHLQVGGGSRDGFRFTPYHPYCKEHSLIPSNDRQFQFEDRCPEVCHLFIDKAVVAKAERRKARRATIKTIIGTPFIWFAKLPPITQALIVFLLIVLSSPQLARTVLDIIKALK